MNKLRTLLFLVLLLPLVANAALISRTITVNGTFTDWTTAPNILTNTGQFSGDCQSGQACELDTIGSVGRDLKTFSFTWDNNYLYLYVERYASSTNTTDWLFYLDEDADGNMETGERIFRVSWQGSNRKTQAQLCPYYPVDTTNGDPVVSGGKGDGYTMPGGSSNGACTTLYSNVIGGAASGLSMESRLAWSQIGLGGPQNIGFHVSSSTGVNLPSQVIDNMDAPNSGGQLFPPDMEVTITSADTQVQANSTITYDITLTNLLYDDFSNIEVDLTFPAQLVYDSHSAPAGTTFVDTDFDSYPDQWQVPALLVGESLVLQVTAMAQPVAMNMNVDTTAEITASTEVDADSSNDLDTITTLVTPAPELTVIKYASSGANSDPGVDITFTSHVSNTSGFDARDVVVEMGLDDFTSFKLGTVSFSDGPVPYSNSNLTISTTEYYNGAVWTYTPISGAGGAPAGYDANVRGIRVTFTPADVISNNEAFLLEYISIIN